MKEINENVSIVELLSAKIGIDTIKNIICADHVTIIKYIMAKCDQKGIFIKQEWFKFIYIIINNAFIKVYE